MGNRTTLWGSVCILLLLIFFIVFSGEKDAPKDLSISMAHSYMEGFRIVSKKDGADAWIITARRADFTKDETLAKMDAITMDLRKNGALLNADHGTYNINTKDLTLEDNIVIRTKDSVIHAQNLSWDSSRGALTTEGKVLIQGNKFTVEGEGLSATEENKVRLIRNVKAVFN